MCEFWEKGFREVCKDSKHTLYDQNEKKFQKIEAITNPEQLLK